VQRLEIGDREPSVRPRPGNVKGADQDLDRVASDHSGAGVVIVDGRAKPGFEPGSQPFFDGYRIFADGFIQLVLDVEDQRDMAPKS